MSAGLMSCVRENSPPMTMENSGAASLSSKSQGSLDSDEVDNIHIFAFALKFQSLYSNLSKEYIVCRNSIGRKIVRKFKNKHQFKAERSAA